MILCLPHTFDENPEAMIKEVEAEFHVATQKVLTIRQKKTYMVYAKGQLGMTEKQKVE